MPDVTRVAAQTLRSAAEVTEDLKQGVHTELQRLRAAHEAVPEAAEGFAFAGALSRVHASWRDRLADVGKECGEVADLLRGTADSYDGNEDDTASSFSPRSSTPSASPFG